MPKAVGFGTKLRYAGVSWVVFHVVQLLPIIFTQQELCCIGKLTMKHLHKPERKSDLVLFSCDFCKCMWNGFLAGYGGPSHF